MIETTEQTDRTPPKEQSYLELKAELRQRGAATKEPVNAPPSEPVAETPKSESAETSEVSTEKPIQESGDKPEKRDRSYRGRVKELIASGRIDLAERLIEENSEQFTKRQLQRLEEKLSKEKRQILEENEQIKKDHEQLKKELQEHRTRKPAEATEIKPPAKQGDDSEPQPGDEPWPEYAKKLAAWQTRQEYKTQREADRAENEKRTSEQKAEEQKRTVNDRLTKFKATKPDWDEKMSQVDHITSINKGLGTVLINSELTGELRYYLADHPEEFEAINGMSEQQAYDETRGLEGYLRRQIKESPKTPEKPKVMPISKAGPPAKVVTGGASDTNSDDPDEAGISLREMKTRLAKRRTRAS